MIRLLLTVCLIAGCAKPQKSEGDHDDPTKAQKSEGDQDVPGTRIYRSLKVGYAASTAARATGTNDNTFAIEEDRGTFVIADGIHASAPGMDPARAVQKAFGTVPAKCGAQLGRKLLNCVLGEVNQDLNDLKATAAVIAAIVIEDQLEAVVAGKANIYLIRNGSMEDLTSGRSESKQLGAAASLSLSRITVNLEPGDAVLLASVGLSQTMSSTQTEAALTKPATTIEKRLLALRTESEREPLPDDVTLILLEARANLDLPPVAQ